MPGDAARAIVSEVEPVWVRDEPGTTASPKPLRVLKVQRADTIEPTRISWLWKGWIPASRLALFGGKPGDGKSSVVLDLAARLSTASPMPDGTRPPEPINVAILSAEDGASDTIIPRLIAAGADRQRVFIVGGMVNEAGIERPWILPDDILELSAFIRENDIAFLVIDPLSAFQSANVDTHRDGAVRAMLLPLSNMADSLNCAVVAVRHHRKGGATDARDAGSGSIAFTAAARIEWAAGTDPHDGSRRILAIAKSNIAAVQSSIAYRLVQDERWETNRVQWDGLSDVTANQLVGDQPTDEERSELDEATDFLRVVLAAGAVAAKTVKKQAAEADIAERTLNRAKKRLAVRSRKLPDGSWVWSYRFEGGQAQVEDCQVDTHTSLGNVGNLGHHPSTHTLNNEGFTREDEQDCQGGQDGRSSDGRQSLTDDYLESFIDEYEGDEP
jgi:putative DNA primase/helicase